MRSFVATLALFASQAFAGGGGGAPRGAVLENLLVQSADVGATRFNYTIDLVGSDQEVSKNTELRDSLKMLVVLKDNDLDRSKQELRCTLTLSLVLKDWKQLNPKFGGLNTVNFGFYFGAEAIIRTDPLTTAPPNKYSGVYATFALNTTSPSSSGFKSSTMVSLTSPFDITAANTTVSNMPI